MGLQRSRIAILRYWAGTPNQHCLAHRVYRRMRIGAAQPELSRNNGERFLVPGYGCVSHADWFGRYCNTVLPNGIHFGYKGDGGPWWLGKISATAPTDGVYLV